MSLRDLPTRIGIWPEIAFLDGVKVPIRGSALSPRMRRHLMRGGYERAERKLLGRLIRPGDRVIELGASLGIVTSLLAKKVAPGGKVAAMEPNRRLHPHFERQLSLNGVEATLVQALGCPIWDGPVPEEIRGQRFTAVENSLSGRAAGAEGDVVPWLTLREVAEQAGLPEPTAIIVDVEGGEQVWTEHAPGLPPSVRTVIVEIHPHLIGEEKSGGCVQALVNEGFRIAGISGTVFGMVR
ncbi:FkbM family methyltransferase [Luteolibacter sp. SL250]|uniref:FkbM family methyltransferase n=1 Tax=Luteolibacter sp. SL250 TaxID=2995170 RepID=UPI00226DDBBA|nr:FkbM family methyltransferase [Luteolibacter sp. SL250]WAC20196.1 FkbM family methyltransferase [Luteolibacter sp. SL250]